MSFKFLVLIVLWRLVKTPSKYKNETIYNQELARTIADDSRCKSIVQSTVFKIFFLKGSFFLAQSTVNEATGLASHMADKQAV